jgi:hypothetical protein
MDQNEATVQSWTSEFSTGTRRVERIQLGEHLLEPCPPSIQAYFRENWRRSQLFIAEQPLREEDLDRWNFRKKAKVCIDGRTGDFEEVIGLRRGVLEEYRSAGAKSDSGSLGHVMRFRDNIRKAMQVEALGKTKRMAVMKMNTVHYSHAYPDTHSCAAWKHQTEKALRYMWRRSEEQNFDYQGDIVSFPVLIDTDLDAITVCGPKGRLAVRDVYKDPQQVDTGCLIEKLEAIFPRSWDPIKSLTVPEHIPSFYAELAELVAANVQFVRRVESSGRPIELLDHQERMIFVGRHAMTLSHNSVFLIDDTESDRQLFSGFEIGLKYVAKNVLLDAIRTDDRDPKIPVIINVPHDDDDLRLTRRYVTELKKRLQRKLNACAEHIYDWLRSDAGIGPDIPHWLHLPLKAFESLVVFSTSVSHRKTRLYVPFESK